MEKHRAIPQGYMTVGEVAKIMNTTVRTLQYYDKEGILTPSAESEGGRRLYTDKDIIKLHQIQSMKYLGFSLDDIKNRLTVLDTPADVAATLAELAASLREKIASLSESLQAIETLKTEALQMQSVDFRKYADIIVNLQLKNKYYWLIKHFDDKTLDDLRSRFDIKSATLMSESINNLLNRAIQYQKDGIQPESKVGQDFAKDFWDKMIEFTSGDVSMLPKLLEHAENSGAVGAESELKKKQENANAFLEPALGIYLAKLGINPFEGVQT
jgi:DNA-binding transcriptional MerR regulator